MIFLNSSIGLVDILVPEFDEQQFHKINFHIPWHIFGAVADYIEGKGNVMSLVCQEGEKCFNVCAHH